MGLGRLANLVVLAAIASTSPASGAEDFGHFSGNPQLEFLPDGRMMKLLKDFSYTDPKQEVWIASAGLITDGASIPQWAWEFIGPYEGKYRNAAIVHDAECTPPYKHDWEAVHEMFYLASRAGGTNEFTAKVMYLAVYYFGPRWENGRKVKNESGGPLDRPLALENARLFVRYYHPTLDQIKSRDLVFSHHFPLMLFSREGACIERARDLQAKRSVKPTAEYLSAARAYEESCLEYASDSPESWPALCDEGGPIDPTLPRGKTSRNCSVGASK